MDRKRCGNGAFQIFNLQYSFRRYSRENTLNFCSKKDMSTREGKTYLSFLKQIYDKKSDKNYDWIFATNVEKIVLEDMLIQYKKRWRIETQFRVQDEARIKCKSKEMKVRYFFFLFEQMLQTTWICFYKDEVPFKKFLIELSN